MPEKHRCGHSKQNNGDILNFPVDSGPNLFHHHLRSDGYDSDFAVDFGHLADQIGVLPGTAHDRRLQSPTLSRRPRPCL